MLREARENTSLLPCERETSLSCDAHARSIYRVRGLTFAIFNQGRCQTREIDSRHARRRKFEPVAIASIARVEPNAERAKRVAETRSRGAVSVKRVYAPPLIWQIVSSRQILLQAQRSLSTTPLRGIRIRHSKPKRITDTKRRRITVYQKCIVTVPVVPLWAMRYDITRVFNEKCVIPDRKLLILNYL